MTSADVLADAYGRVNESVHEAVTDLTVDDLHERLDSDANPIAWLVWHLTRVQDDHIADAKGTEQLWTTEGWSERFDLPLPTATIGYGHSSAEVAAVRVTSPHLLTDYHDAVHARTVRFVTGLDDSQLDRVLDARWDPPVTLGVRLVSVIADGLQHAGQAAFIRGILLRR
ncbi:mycothiol transferase [Haloechinothrix sp. LS1_15]|uniref:mycothiol transferase n=1 Tax=Haloechinothrix sp. LS1_15 TaxID=2652248 RepID=UPI0029456170|nr:DUF664 domain-containing protein [Haloechinothrix sp. LS1_15]MDV6012189.1 DUF664 domain-containing protein [Haloechinothrix sp. LS1_15]